MTISTESMEGKSHGSSGRALDIQGAATIDLRMNVLAGSCKYLLVDLARYLFWVPWDFVRLFFRRKQFTVTEAKWHCSVRRPWWKNLKASNIDKVIPIFHDLDSAVASLC